MSELVPNNVEVTWDQLIDVTGYLVSCTATTLCASGQLQTVIVNGGAKRSSLLSVSGSEKIVIA